MYNPQNAKEVEAGLPPGISAEGVIIGVQDGKSKDFVKNTEKWMGDLENPAINVQVLAKHDNKDYTFSKMFTYKNGPDGMTEVNVKSNLGKYKKFYGKLPQSSDKVKCMTSADGFWRLLIE